MDFHGNFYMSNTTDVELAGINPQQVSSISCLLPYDTPIFDLIKMLLHFAIS